MSEPEASGPEEHERTWRSALRQDQLMASLSCLEALKRGTLAAGILIFSPVWGLRPSPALRLETWKVPKPTRRTFSFFFNDLVITVSIASIAPAASVLDRLVEAATAAIKSCLFTGTPPMVRQPGV